MLAAPPVPRLVSCVSPRAPLPRAVLPLLSGTLLLVAAFLWGLHFLHLRADFPNHSPWMDWAKYTDEGWYGDAAIRHFQRGHWYVPGDFNPAVALPVFPLLEAAIFRVAGTGVVQARAFAVILFGITLVLAYMLLRRARTASGAASSLAPAAAVTLLAASPFCYAFGRMAILEPLLNLLMLLALLAADAAPVEGWRPGLSAPRFAPLLALGVLLPALILTKTTALFLFPSILFVLWARGHFRLSALLRNAGLAATLGVAIWCGYLLLVRHFNLLADYRYLFSANGYTMITLDTALAVVFNTVRDTGWIGAVSLLFVPILLMSVAGAFNNPVRRLQTHRTACALVLWIFGYGVFLAWHNNLQPRYYLVVALPITLFVVLQIEQLGRWSLHAAGWLRQIGFIATGVGVALLLVTFVIQTRQTLGFVRHPEFTFYNAARQIAAITRADARRNPLVLSISGSDLSLMTGIPSICDDFGTLELEDRVALYHPGWYVSWNQVDDDKMDALSPRFHLHRVAAFPAMDDPERNLLILYRLDPPVPEHPQRHRRRATPKRLATHMGQQPSVSQLEH